MNTTYNLLRILFYRLPGAIRSRLNLDVFIIRVGSSQNHTLRKCSSNLVGLRLATNTTFFPMSSSGIVLRNAWTTVRSSSPKRTRGPAVCQPSPFSQAILPPPVIHPAKSSILIYSGCGARLSFPTYQF